MQVSIEEMYGDGGIEHATFETILNRSLNPRPATMLYDKMGELGLSTHHLVLDLGCRDARHTCELALRYQCQLVGVDPVEHNLRRAEQGIAAQNLGHQVTVRSGRAEAIPADDNQFDYVWCRDVLTHVA